MERENLIYFPNWSDTEFVTPEVQGDTLKSELGFKETDQIVLYAGNIGQKQGLEIVLDAAKEFIEKQKVKFVFIGAGSYVETLKAMANEKQLNNVIFLPLQQW